MKTSNYESAGWLSKLTFQWMQSLIMLGRLRPLTEADLPKIPDADEGRYLVEQLQSAWELEQQSTSPSLWRVLYKVYGGLFFWAGFMAALETVAKILESVFLGYIIQFFRQEDAPLSDGLWYCTGMVIAVFLHGILHHQYFWAGLRCGVRIKTGLISLIYRKSLHLTSSSSFSSGSVVNLISNDVQTFEVILGFVHYVWLGPVETIVVGVLLYLHIGWAALVGLSTFLIYLPMQYWFSKRFMRIRSQTSSFRDNRIRMLSDVLLGINLIKLSSWEAAMKDIILILRGDELNSLKRAANMKATNESLYFSFPCVIASIAFTSYWAFNNGLSPEHVFVSLSLFNTIRLTMTNFFPKSVEGISESRISVKRISEYLILPESNKVLIHPDSKSDDKVISVDDASFMWSSPGVLAKESLIQKSRASKSKTPLLEDRSSQVLSNISLDIKRGELVAIAGPVGSGKTSLCMALLGELFTSSGRLYHHNIKETSLRLSYASQIPWILAGTIRDNILFGSEYNEIRFKQVVQVCSLEIDMSMFSHRDLTIIGERGVSLSGGQRARIALARALYQDVDVYILDDPLSAVDPKVGRHLFKQAIQQFLKDKVVILVTHQLQFINECHRVLVLDNGTIQYNGSVEELMKKDTGTNLFLKILQEFSNVDEVSEKKVESESNIKSEASSVHLDEPVAVVKEDRHQGSTSKQIYVDFLKFGGSSFTIILMIILLLVGQALSIGADYFLSMWTGMAHDQQMDYINPIIHGSLTLGVLTVGLIRGFFFFFIMLNASGGMFKAMLDNVLLSPISFFHNNPHGRILNRFSKDQSLVDEQLPLNAFDTIQCTLMIVGAIIIVCIVNPWVLISIPFILGGFWWLRSIYIITSREIKRIESVTRSPIYSLLSETLEGLATVRAFSAESAFLDRFLDYQSINTKSLFVFMGTARWLGFRLDMLSSLFLGVAGYSIVLSRSTQQASMVGLSLSSVLQLIGLVQWAIRQSIEVEIAFIAVERIIEYSKLTPELPKIADIRPPEGWPSQGKIELRGLNLAYAENPPVLKDISLTIKPHEKIGVVGRTGAGKSSLVTALFRLIEPFPEGCITIDDVNISEIGLGDLRENLSIIPQEPFLFRGTIRFNLDPLNKYSDQAIWEAINASELTNLIESIPGKLDGQVNDNGGNFSVGERQLLSLCRAILRQPRILIMDEATANVDLGTDRLIQTAIKSHFKSSTVLTIAHRLHTVIGDYDRILVLDQGQVKEFDYAWTLLQDPNSLLSNMVHQTGTDSEQTLRQLAQNQFNQLKN